MPTRDEAAAAIKTLLSYIGEDITRPGLEDTPGRFLKAWEEEWGRGYHQDPESLIRLFEPEGPEIAVVSTHYDEMIVVRDINFYSACEHHLAPFFGAAHIAYVPSRLGIVGLSKLARVVDHFARRLQVQERLTVQIADFLAFRLSRHVGVMLTATHLCMVSRGVMQPNAKTVTTAIKGHFTIPTVRAEFLNACKG